VLASAFDHLMDLGLRDLVREDSANADPPAMDHEHDLSRVLGAHSKEPFQHIDDEFHGRVVVVDQ